MIGRERERESSVRLGHKILRTLMKRSSLWQLPGVFIIEGPDIGCDSLREYRLFTRILLWIAKRWIRMMFIGTWLVSQYYYSNSLEIINL